MLNLRILTAISVVISAVILILTIFWASTHMKMTLDVTDENLYNLHSIFMVSGMVFCFGNSILVFRTFRTASKTKTKTAHGVLHGLAVFFIFLGLAVEYIPFYYSGKHALYSLHSWLGLISIIIFSSQFIFGIVCYTSAAIAQSIKIFYMPIHVFLGNFCFVLSLATCLVGLNQNARFNMNYPELPREGVLINCIGVLMVIYGGLVIFLTTGKKTEIVQKNLTIEKVEK